MLLLNILIFLVIPSPVGLWKKSGKHFHHVMAAVATLDAQPGGVKPLEIRPGVTDT